jgi:hypothetical protein
LAIVTPLACAARPLVIIAGLQRGGYLVALGPGGW